MSKRRKYLFKVLIVGDGGVGKTTMVKRLITGRYIEQKITIGTDLFAYNLEKDGKEIVLQLWDFAGERRFRFFLPNYSRGAMGCLLCYDLARRSSFENLEEWFDIVNNNADDPVIFLVACKHDLAEEKRVVEKEEAKEFQNNHDISKFFETSSLTGYNNEIIFKDLANEIIEKKNIPM